MTEVHFKKLELVTEYPSDPITFGTERKIWFLHPLDHWRVQFPKPGKYYIINKSNTFTPFCYTYVKLLKFVSFLQKSQQLFFSRKTRILVKTRKIIYLLTVNKYLYQFLVDCTIVELSQKKKEFQY